MPRFSISIVMAVVALAAANCAVIRAVFPGDRVWDGFGIVVVGLLPLLDAQVIGLYLLASRYRISLRPGRRMSMAALLRLSPRPMRWRSWQ